MTVLPERRHTAWAAAYATLLVATPVYAEGNVAEVQPEAVDTAQLLKDCLGDAIASADDAVTVGEIRAQCNQAVANEAPAPFTIGPVDGPTAVDERAAKEDRSMDRNFIMTAHNPNYVLATYSSTVNQEPFAEVSDDPEPLNNGEVKFQLSIKAPIWRSPFGWRSDLFFAYSTTSWWQLGNANFSNPFRETVYEPELFLRYYQQSKVLGLKVSSWDLGFDHQSNGRSGDLSRSWNRVMARTVIDLNDAALMLRAWYRLPEDADSDDNPDISDYAGYGDIRAVWVPSRNTYSLMLRPAAKGSAVELTWSRPISKIWRVYAQYWNGYDESLLDYNFRTKRIGIGFALSDYLER